MKTHTVDLGDGYTMEPVVPMDTAGLPKCPKGCGDLALVASGCSDGVSTLTCGCYSCRGLYDVQAGKVVREIKS